MTQNEELPGIYFGETVNTIGNTTSVDEVLCFVIQTSTAIEALDNQLTLQTSFGAFQELCTGKGLDLTLQFISDILSNTEHTEFYVYSVKTDTTDGFKEAVNCSEHLKEIRKIIYFEETLSVQANTINSKMNALTTACHTCYKYGAFRVAYVVPYATIEKAVTDAENVKPEQTVITTFTSILNGLGDGRLVAVLPDAPATIMSTIISAPFHQDPARDTVTGDVSLKYKFNRSQMKTLMNMGVIFIRENRFNGVNQYKILSGVNTGFKNGASDGVISSRNIADELLHDIDMGLDGLINDKEHVNNVTFAQTTIDGIIAEYDTNGYVLKDGTNLTVIDAGNMKFEVTGQITTVKPLKIIDVNTVIN